MRTSEVRRVALAEWREVRDLRLRAVRDPAAPVAFMTTLEQELARDEAFWRERAAGAALSDESAQFVAVVGDRWVGTATVLIRPAGEPEGAAGDGPARATVVGVYIDAGHRGSGILARLFDAADEWAGARGAAALTLEVHADNARARAAYTRLGFAPTGREFTSVIGPELEMQRALR
ncbi:GNAT family N-acetyltransferase [Microbacterium sp. 179-B 1A2 NHS]|uniref:GNAT family N-acetyltransferase n=1 Tax=Microbacterium sp. 179-B 1A2 NHS TaxID=3142383 RepID=UPI0039A343FD